MSLLFGEVELMETVTDFLDRLPLVAVASLRRSGINGNKFFTDFTAAQSEIVASLRRSGINGN